MLFITTKELIEIMEAGSGDYEIDNDKINKLLLDKCQQGYMITDDLFSGDNIDKESDEYSTHKLFIFTDPLEPEKVECDLDHNQMYWTFKMTHNDSDLGENVGYNVPPCPKCGEALNA